MPSGIVSRDMRVELEVAHRTCRSAYEGNEARPRVLSLRSASPRTDFQSFRSVILRPIDGPLNSQDTLRGSAAYLGAHRRGGGGRIEPAPLLEGPEARQASVRRTYSRSQTFMKVLLS